MSDLTYHFLNGLLKLGLILVMMAWVIWRAIKKSDSPMWLIARLIMTAIILYGIATEIVPMMRPGNPSALIAVPLGAMLGLALAMIWAPAIAGWFGKKAEALFTGGDTPAEPKPVYSGALAARAAGKAREAIYLVQEQLEQFPEDFAGQMIIADLQANDLRDLPAAEATVTRLCTQPQHPAAAISFALTSLADWHLAIGKDPEAAARLFTQIQERFPDTEYYLLAAQRLAHLPTRESLAEPQERKPIKIPQFRRNLGLQKLTAEELTAILPPEEQAAELVAQLEKHPLDLEAREKLALMYAEKLGRLDLAGQQLEQMIACPNVAPRQIVHWLNLLASVQLRLGSDLAAATATLQRIISTYPGSSFAIQAEERLQLLPNEIRHHRENPDIKLGEYEQYLGLKMKRSR